MRISLTENEYRALNKALATEPETSACGDNIRYSSGEHDDVIAEITYYPGCGISFDCYLK